LNLLFGLVSRLQKDQHGKKICCWLGIPKTFLYPSIDQKICACLIFQAKQKRDKNIGIDTRSNRNKKKLIRIYISLTALYQQICDAHG
jgi:hypothetical protein